MWRTEEAKQQNTEERLYVSLTSVVSSLVVDVGEYCATTTYSYTWAKIVTTSSFILSRKYLEHA